MAVQVCISFFLVFLIMCMLSRSVLNESSSGSAVNEIVLATVNRLTLEADIIGSDIIDQKDYPKVLEALALTKAALYICQTNMVQAPVQLLEVYDTMNDKRNVLFFEQ
jgi:di/tripeptidase